MQVGRRMLALTIDTCPMPSLRYVGTRTSCASFVQLEHHRGYQCRLNATLPAHTRMQRVSTDMRRRADASQPSMIDEYRHGKGFVFEDTQHRPEPHAVVNWADPAWKCFKTKEPPPGLTAPRFGRFCLNDRFIEPILREGEILHGERVDQDVCGR